MINIMEEQIHLGESLDVALPSPIHAFKEGPELARHLENVNWRCKHDDVRSSKDSAE